MTFEEWAKEAGWLQSDGTLLPTNRKHLAECWNASRQALLAELGSEAVVEKVKMILWMTYPGGGTAEIVSKEVVKAIQQALEGK